MNKHSEGFSTVELLYTLIIAAMFLTMFYQTYVIAEALSGRAYDLARVNEKVYQKVQQYENREFTTISTPNGTTPTEIEDFVADLPDNIAQPATAKVFTAALTPTLKAVNVKATYGSGNSQRIVEYTTYIQESGLGR